MSVRDRRGECGAAVCRRLRTGSPDQCHVIEPVRCGRGGYDVLIGPGRPWHWSDAQVVTDLLSLPERHRITIAPEQREHVLADEKGVHLWPNGLTERDIVDLADALGLPDDH